MATKSKVTRPLPAAAAVCSAYEGGVRVDNIAFGEDNPQQRIDQAFKKARYWFKYNFFVQRMTLLRMAFFNFGFAVRAASKKDKAAVKLWWEDEENQKRARKYVDDAWQEWLLLSNICAIWRTQGGRPLVYPLEDVEFKDVFGIEVLTLTHTLTDDAIRKMQGLTPAEKAALQKTRKLVLTHDDEKLFKFDVVKRERVGMGFAWPALAVMFQTCSQNEGMEVGDAVRGNLLRNVIEQHKIGHEIKGGIHAGEKAHFCKKENAEKVEKSLKGKVGHIRLVTNFDHEIAFPCQDPKHFEAKRYDGPFRRFEAWAMPLAQMVYAKNFNPTLMGLLQTEAIAERERLTPHFNLIFREALGAPAGARAGWSNRCFRDSRLAMDLMKFGVQAGPLSQGTFLEEGGFDPDQERERKQEESGLPKAQTFPLYDPSHGPGDQKQGGRKAGTADHQGQ